ncbi:MAG: hypothetical protein AB7N29_15065 [Vicinamibacterales bacterium]
MRLLPQTPLDWVLLAVAAALLFLAALESARRVRLPRTLVDDRAYRSGTGVILPSLPSLVRAFR